MGKGRTGGCLVRLYRLPALLIAVVALSLTPTSTLAVVYPTVTLNPSSGPPGQKFVATGVNFHPNTTIYAVETVLRLTTTSDAAGNMTMYFQVDSSSPPRSVRIQFFEGNMH